MSLKYFLLIFLFSVGSLASRSKPFTIMLDPAGDAREAGRKINDYFERGITLQYAEKLKKALEGTLSNVRIVLTRFPGETIQPLQNASFANRLDVDFYISIHFFSKPKGKHTIGLYYFCSHPTTDYWKPSLSSELAFTTAHNAHKDSIDKSKQWAKELHATLEKDYKDHFVSSKPLGIPFKPLYGIQAPAIGIEASLQSADDWTRYVKPLSEGITSLVEQTKKGRKSRAAFI